jgi:hypothetical protein
VAPEVSVLVPLEDLRGDAAEYLQTWTSAQALARERYQVVLAGDGSDPEGERRLEALLAPQDALVRAPGANLIDLWNAAASRADAPSLLFTEAHCLADRGCLDAVVRAVEADPDLDAASLDHGHHARTASAELGARWFDELHAVWDRDHWRHLNFVGAVVRRDAFNAAGGLDPTLGVFAIPALAARLHERGARVGHVDEATVAHVHNDSLADHHALSADWVVGECRVRSVGPSAYCERYFGHDGIWANRLAYRPEIARALARDVADAVARAAVRRREDVPWLTRELARRLPACVGGARPGAAAEGLRVRVNEIAAERLPLPADARYARYLQGQEAAVRRARLGWVRDHVTTPPAPAPARGRWAVDELDDTVLVGAHALERDAARAYRWTEPVTLLRVAAPEGEHELVLDTGGLRGRPQDYVTGAYVGGRRVSRDRLRGDATRLVVPLPRHGARPRSGGGITILSRPLDPRMLGAEDPRPLGMPLFSVEVRRVEP